MIKSSVNACQNVYRQPVQMDMFGTKKCVVAGCVARLLVQRDIFGIRHHVVV
ncbi:MAG: hypothetical protein ACPK85_09245 [Methanosarcina sp.]